MAEEVIGSGGPPFGVADEEDVVDDEVNFEVVVFELPPGAGDGGHEAKVEVESEEDVVRGDRYSPIIHISLLNAEGVMGEVAGVAVGSAVEVDGFNLITVGWVFEEF